MTAHRPITNEATPGPWTVIDNSWEVSTVYGPDGEAVAECPINSIVTEETQFEHEAVKEANARLISAAPDMLAALENLVNCFEKHRPKAYWDAARTAITKATGGAQ